MMLVHVGDRSHGYTVIRVCDNDCWCWLYMYDMCLTVYMVTLWYACVTTTAHVDSVSHVFDSLHVEGVMRVTVTVYISKSDSVTQIF